MEPAQELYTDRRPIDNRHPPNRRGEITSSPDRGDGAPEHGKPHPVGVQIPRGVHSQVPQKGALRRTEAVPRGCVSQSWGHRGPDRRCAASAPARRSRRRSGPALPCPSSLAKPPSARCWRGRVPYCPARASFFGNHLAHGGALGVGGELDAVGRPETTVGHLLTRACASVVEARGSFARGFLDAGSRLRLITPETTLPSIPTNPATGPTVSPSASAVLRLAVLS